MTWSWCCVNEGCNQRKMGSKSKAVCSEEKASADIVKMRPAQTNAGHQARSQLGMRGGPRRSWISVNWGAGFGLRHGSPCGTRIRLLPFLVSASGVAELNSPALEPPTLARFLALSKSLRSDPSTPLKARGRGYNFPARLFN